MEYAFLAVLGLALLWALATLFPSERKMHRNITRNASRPMGSVDRSWQVAGLIVAIVLVLGAYWLLGS